MHGWTGPESDSQLPFPFATGPQRRNGRVLWILAATPRDSRHIAAHLCRPVRAALPSLVFCLDDGTTPIDFNDIVAFKVDDQLRLFTGINGDDPAEDSELADGIELAFQRANVGRSRTRIAQECLFLRLAGGRQMAGSADDCEHELGRSLALIRKADPRRDARFIHEVAGDLLDRLPSEASPLLTAMLRRLKGGAIYELCKSVFGFERSHLEEAALLYRSASGGFACAGLPSQADRCERDFRAIEELSSAHSSAKQLPLPGFEKDAAPVPHLRRLGLHAFRVLAIPLALPSVGTNSLAFSRPPAVLRPAGAFQVTDRSLLRALEAFQSTSLVPQLAVTAAGGLRKRLRLSLDREHLAMLGLPDRSGAEGGEPFSFFAAARGWRVSPAQGSVRPGRPVELVAKPPSIEAPPLQLVVHDGFQSSRFEVSASS